MTVKTSVETSKDINKPEQLITEHIDIWTSAILAKSTNGRGSGKKYELYGITKLRELILELAVRGKLVPQDANDEPASVLLEKIEAEKAQLIKDKKIKKPKKLAKISDDEHYFSTPQGWHWSRLNDIGEWGAGATPSRSNSKYYGGGIPWFKSGELSEDYISVSQETITESALKETSIRENKSGDVLLAMYGATIGKASILEVAGTTNQAVCACTPFSGVTNTFLLMLLKAYRARFIGMGAGGAQPNISREKIIATVIALPPTAEQKRIVAKVDELMLLCDQLEQQTEASIDAHATLVDVLLATLTESSDADELTQNWARMAEHFDSLFTTEQSIEALKQTVLQLAVMGKLVPQNPEDEPASVLLEKIAEEKEQLVEQGEIRKSKSLDKVNEEEKLYDLPFNWEWTRLGDIAAVGTGATPSRNESKYWSSQDINWVSSGETSEPFIFDTKEKVSHLAIKETNVSVYPPGTLVVAMYGQGKTRGQITELKIEAGTNQACAAIRLIQLDELHRYYIKLFFWKSYEEIRSNAAGGAQPNLNVSKITSTVIPLPPLAEQHRIVAKVDELMTICNQLKVKLQQSQETQVQLTDALIDRALG
ncbi:restriction endonuclease subunit S [Psychrobacter pacificensis]|uniref:restriction endonuclease subunit S n=1 Tax=Psychrobacter pacificensis TaxID=112002 RepID=UPI003D0281B3